MAIGNYSDVYTLDRYKQRVQDISDSLASEKANIVSLKNTAKQELQAQIQLLEQKEKTLYQILGVENLEQLRVRIKEYSEAFCPLSGEKLRQACILPYKSSFDDELKNLQRDINVFVVDVLKENAFVFEDLALDEFHTIMKQVLNKGGHNFSAQSGYTSKGINVSMLTKPQRRRYQQLIKEKYKEAKAGEVTGTSNGKTEFEFNFGIEWYEQTEGLSKSEAIKRNMSEEEIERRNRIIVNNILNYCGGEDRKLIRDIIYTKVLNEDKFAFFVGQNEKDITGILGEIQGLYYIAKLLGTKRGLSWVGGVPEGGSKPHRDLILKNIGIQIKNTTKELTDSLFSVNFANAQVDTMLNRTNLSPSLKNLLINYYSTKAFNVPYVLEGEKFIAKADDLNAEFQSSAKTLEDYNSQIDTLLAIFAATFMYIDVNKNFNKKTDANTLYILGASSVVVASEILSSIKAQLEGAEHSFSVSGTLPKNLTIVDILNSSSEDIEALLKKTNQSSITGAVTSKLVLTSSFSFKI